MWKARNVARSLWHTTAAKCAFVRWMGGPSSHLKQLKGLVRKAHLTLPLEHDKVKMAALEAANRRVEDFLRCYDMEHMPPCDRASCRASEDGVWCRVPVAFPPRNWQRVSADMM